ncbi:hypothetical protein RIF29_38308 [Crotalaria pallida]|uniref:Uncharacterized protein n=1 Tax=Crotalaria pallida TaxID=3830 RepID=A0AAN9HNN2_CROPI
MAGGGGSHGSSPPPPLTVVINFLFLDKYDTNDDDWIYNVALEDEDMLEVEPSQAIENSKASIMLLLQRLLTSLKEDPLWTDVFLKLSDERKKDWILSLA